jgi:predicted RNA binding protein YcfA (HicA-like mRNA interferase family)
VRGGGSLIIARASVPNESFDLSAVLVVGTVPSVKIRDMIRLLESKGWHLERTRGSHRQYHHPDRPGTVTVAGRPGQDLSQEMIRSILKQAGLAKDLP